MQCIALLRDGASKQQLSSSSREKGERKVICDLNPHTGVWVWRSEPEYTRWLPPRILVGFLPLPLILCLAFSSPHNNQINPSPTDPTKSSTSSISGPVPSRARVTSRWQEAAAQARARRPAARGPVAAAAVEEGAAGRATGTAAAAATATTPSARSATAASSRASSSTPTPRATPSGYPAPGTGSAPVTPLVPRSLPSIIITQP